MVRSLFALGLLFVTACDNGGPEKRMTDYISRLGNTLDASPRFPARESLDRLPATAKLRLELPPGNIDTLDFLSLSGCALQVTIGKRNSSLGIFASDSQRLLLELEYLQLAPACITHMRDTNQAELAAVLEDAYDLKQQQLPGLIYNATLANTEFQRFWAAPVHLHDYPENTNSAVITAVNAITALGQQWLAGDYRADNKGFELLLAELLAGDGGALAKALATQEAALLAGNQILAQSLEQGPLCGRNYRNRAADILPKVIQKYFINEVQPHSAAIGRRYHTLLPPVRALETLLETALPKTYLDWRATRDETLLRLFARPAEHVRLLKEVLKPCQDNP